MAADPVQSEYERRIKRDAEEAFGLLSGYEIIFVEGAWVCACEDDTAAYALPDIHERIKFAFCDTCQAGAIVTVWGGA